MDLSGAAGQRELNRLHWSAILNTHGPVS